MTEQEESEQLRQWIAERKQHGFDYLLHLARLADRNELASTGYTKDSLHKAALSIDKEIETKIRAHERKWPGR